MSTTIIKTTNLLVVDPRPDDYLQLAAEVKAAPYRFVYATTGDAALRLPGQSSFGLWFINLCLPDMAGAELLALLRSRDPETACILIGDSYSAADELAARQFGATLYGVKPPLAQWLRAIPVGRKPRERDHFAHAPPGRGTMQDIS